MPSFNLEKSIHINCAPSEAFRSLSNMKEWADWSPWLIMDPNAKIDVKQGNSEYSWEGQHVGSGQMQIVDKVENQEITYDLTFLKPWKSKSMVKMIIDQEGEGTKVRWQMYSKLPFFMFWMKKMMTAYVGNDYERGLRMLKDHLEKGEIESKLNFKGQSEYPGCNFIGIKRTCTTEDIATLMEKDFTELMEFGSRHGLDETKAFSHYLKWDMVNGKASYIAGLPYEKLPQDVPTHFIKGNIPACKIYSVEHKGRYDHIGNAWSTMYALHRNKVFKPNKKIAPFETYGNSPKNTAPQDLLATINFAVK